MKACMSVRVWSYTCCAFGSYSINLLLLVRNFLAVLRASFAEDAQARQSDGDLSAIGSVWCHD